MRLKEMVEVLAVDLTADPHFDPEKRLLDPRDVLTICSSLVSLTAAEDGNSDSDGDKDDKDGDEDDDKDGDEDEDGEKDQDEDDENEADGIDEDTNGSTHTTGASGSEVLRLAHFSVKEYLIAIGRKEARARRWHISLDSANISITKTCLAYLSYFDDSEFNSISVNLLKTKLPLSDYAANFWTLHYSQITTEVDRTSIDSLTYESMKSGRKCFRAWLQIFKAHNSAMGYPSGDDPIATPLYYMSLFGIRGVVQELLNNRADYNARGREYGNTLQAAAY